MLYCSGYCLRIQFLFMTQYMTLLVCIACRLFKTYDFDSDGKISLYDLKMTLEIQNGRDYNVSNENGEDYALLCTWISQRDTTGTGYVNYDDFVRYYAQESN